MAEDEKSVGNFISNNFKYSGAVVVVVWSVEHIIEK